MLSTSMHGRELVVALAGHRTRAAGSGGREHRPRVPPRVRPPLSLPQPLPDGSRLYGRNHAVSPGSHGQRLGRARSSPSSSRGRRAQRSPPGRRSPEPRATKAEANQAMWLRESMYENGFEFGPPPRGWRRGVRQYYPVNGKQRPGTKNYGPASWSFSPLSKRRTNHITFHLDTNGYGCHVTDVHRGMVYRYFFYEDGSLRDQWRRTVRFVGGQPDKGPIISLSGPVPRRIKKSARDLLKWAHQYNIRRSTAGRDP